MARRSQMVLGLLVMSSMCAKAVRVQEEDIVAGDNAEGELCAPSIVAQTCALLKDVQSLEEVLSMPVGTGHHFMETLGLTGEYSCTKMCDAITQRLAGAKTLPPSSDIGCMVIEGKEQCDIDLTPSAVESFLRVDEMPDLGDKAIIDVEERAGTASAAASTSSLLQNIVNSDESLVHRTATLFRIYPMRIVSQAPVPGGSLVETEALPQWKLDAYKINTKSVAYLSTTMKKFGNKNTKDSMIKWFGKSSYDDTATRAELQRVMNGVTAMLDMVEYVYDKTQCNPNTYAFVYPRVIGSVVQQCDGVAPSDGEKCVQNSEGKFMFFLCDVYMNGGESEQIETLLHEGSHHAAAYTTDVCINEFFYGNKAPFYKTVPLASIGGKGLGDRVWVPVPMSKVEDTWTEMGGDVLFKVFEIKGSDAVLQVMDDFDDCMNDDAHVAYGRGTCTALARLNPAKALRNADNFCYYVVDVMTGNGGTLSDKEKCFPARGGRCVDDRVEMYNVRGDLEGKMMFPRRSTDKCSVKFDGKHVIEEVACGSLSDPWVA